MTRPQTPPMTIPPEVAELLLSVPRLRSFADDLTLARAAKQPRTDLRWCGHCYGRIGAWRRSDAVYCSDACKQDAYRERSGQQRPAPVHVSYLPCPDCGEPHNRRQPCMIAEASRAA